MVVRRAATLAVTATVVAGLLAGCSSKGGDDAKETTTTAAPAEETTTTEAGPDLEELGGQVQDLLETADAAIDEEADARDAFAEENDLDGAIDSTRDLRATLYDVDADLRDLELPDELSEELNALLTANGGFIDALDGFLEIEDIPAYNDQLDLESEARVQWYEAAAELADALEIDGVENDIAADDPGGDDEPVSEDVIGAGEIAGDDYISIQVPEGFTASSGFPIEMTDANGNTVGVYEVGEDSPDQTLEERAAAYADGVAEKNGYQILGDPEVDTIGGYPGIGYAFAVDESTSAIEIVFEAPSSVGTRFHVISVQVADADLEAVIDALTAVEDTLTVA